MRFTVYKTKGDLVIGGVVEIFLTKTQFLEVSMLHCDATCPIFLAAKCQTGYHIQIFA